MPLFPLSLFLHVSWETGGLPFPILPSLASGFSLLGMPPSIRWRDWRHRIGLSLSAASVLAFNTHPFGLRACVVTFFRMQPFCGGSLLCCPLPLQIQLQI
eukprot:RCo016005